MHVALVEEGLLLTSDSASEIGQGCFGVCTRMEMKELIYSPLFWILHNSLFYYYSGVGMGGGALRGLSPPPPLFLVEPPPPQNFCTKRFIEYFALEIKF